AAAAPSAASSPAAPLPAAQAAAPAAPPAAGTAAARTPLSPRVLVHYGDFGGAGDARFCPGPARGYFARAGIGLEAIPINSGGRMVPALGAGQIEVGGGGISAALINAIAREVPLRMVADKGSLRPGFSYEAVLARADLMNGGAIKTAADLRGRKI